MPNTVTSFFIDTLTTLLSTSGLFLAFVVTLYLLQRLTCGLAARQFGGKSIYLSAIVGTPVHEISHALICLPFFHKINEVALFKPDGTGTLGYVTHSYNPANLWQQIGNFFIGVAPLFGGTAAIYILTYSFLPYGENVIDVIDSLSAPFSHTSGFTTFVTALFDAVLKLSSVLWVIAQDSPGKFAIWMYLTAAIALHMSPSPADLRGSVKGALLLLLVLGCVRLISDQAWESLLDHLASGLLSLSITYSICILLAGSLAFFVFAFSLVSKK
ncbi:hypothetical protein R7D97_16505 [Vibrio sp. Vb5031]|uniref:hypothetical protein n=1 Tax=unclassified Vibrio TaxID=2614977 RepID=UPI0009A377E9|nr:MULTISPECIES: hypothetical protein [unclassified Vibrio]MDW1505786.1 hypothetical protein [Vibrio sp. Vb5031]MDW2456247.1 hypothetical protein [Vibrio sp. 1249-1]